MGIEGNLLNVSSSVLVGSELNLLEQQFPQSQLDLQNTTEVLISQFIVWPRLLDDVYLSLIPQSEQVFIIFIPEGLKSDSKAGLSLLNPCFSPGWLY